MGLSVVLVVHDLSNGAVARAQALTEVLEHLGHSARTLSVVGEHLWPPLRGTAYALTCARVTPQGLEAAIAGGTDLVIAVKAMPRSLGLARRLARRHGVPLIADVDDPDVEARTSWLPLPVRLSRARRHPRHHLELALLGRAARRAPSTVSNPVLQQMYGGELVPHARRDRGAGRPHRTDRPVLAFIGTVAPHKGVDLLRAAVARLAGEGWTLLVTAEPPPDAQPWERWVGAHVPDSHALLSSADVVVVPSTRPSYAPGALPEQHNDFGRAQLPLKLIDAMLCARAVVVADYGPLSWAAGGISPTFAAGDVAELVEALRPLRDPCARQRAGDALRELALRRYTPEAVAPALERAITAVVSGSRAGRAPVASQPSPA